MDWNSSALWGIIGLIGGFIISFIFYKIGIKNKKIIYTINSQVLITNNLSKINGLNITYQNQPITDLTTTTIIIKSVGKDIINVSDFGKATPFGIKTTGKFFLQNDINSIIIKNSNLDNLIEPIFKDDSTILLNFDYLSQGDEITFILLHTKTIDICGKLKAGVLLNNNIFKKFNFVIDIILYTCSGLLVFFIAIGYMLCKGANGTLVNIGNFLLNLLLGVILLNYFKKIFNKINSIEINISDSDNSSISF
jgi:hypothetical protein